MHQFRIVLDLIRRDSDPVIPKFVLQRAAAVVSFELGFVEFSAVYLRDSVGIIGNLDRGLPPPRSHDSFAGTTEVHEEGKISCLGRRTPLRQDPDEPAVPPALARYANSFAPEDGSQRALDADWG